VIAMSEYPDDDEDPEERICSTLRWGEVSLPLLIRIDDLDALILSELSERTRKVARIVYRVFETLEGRSIYLKPEVIAARVRELAETGRIEAVGNLTMWRHSEVRLKPP
jgi:hypothetical protein